MTKKRQKHEKKCEKAKKTARNEDGEGCARDAERRKAAARRKKQGQRERARVVRGVKKAATMPKARKLCTRVTAVEVVRVLGPVGVKGGVRKVRRVMCSATETLPQHKKTQHHLPITPHNTSEGGWDTKPFKQYWVFIYCLFVALCL